MYVETYETPMNFVFQHAFYFHVFITAVCVLFLIVTSIIISHVIGARSRGCPITVLKFEQFAINSQVSYLCLLTDLKKKKKMESATDLFSKKFSKNFINFELRYKYD